VIFLTPFPNNRNISGLSESGKPIGYCSIPDIVAVIVNRPETIFEGSDFFFTIGIPVPYNTVRPFPAIVLPAG